MTTNMPRLAPLPPIQLPDPDRWDCAFSTAPPVPLADSPDDRADGLAVGIIRAVDFGSAERLVSVQGIGPGQRTAGSGYFLSPEAAEMLAADLLQAAALLRADARDYPTV